MLQALYIAMIGNMAFRLIGFLQVRPAEFLALSDDNVTLTSACVKQTLSPAQWQAPVNTRLFSWVLGTGLVYAGQNSKS